MKFCRGVEGKVRYDRGLGGGQTDGLLMVGGREGCGAGHRSW